MDVSRERLEKCWIPNDPFVYEVRGGQRRPPGQRSLAMTRYLISFPSDAMDHIPEEEMPEVARAAHAVIDEAKDAGVYIFTAGWRRTWSPSWWLVTGRSAPALIRRPRICLEASPSSTCPHVRLPLSGPPRSRPLAGVRRGPGVHVRPARLIEGPTRGGSGVDGRAFNTRRRVANVAGLVAAQGGFDLGQVGQAPVGGRPSHAERGLLQEPVDPGVGAR